MKNCLGVDQSKSQTGICRAWETTGFATEKFKVKALGPVDTLAEWSRYMRLYLDGPAKPDLVAYEIPALVQVTNMILYQISGVLIHMCLRRNIPIIGVHNATLKKWAGITRDKPIAYACALCGVDKMTGDEADAAVLAEIAFYVANPEFDPGTAIKREIVCKLRMTEAEKADAKETALLAAAQKRVSKEQQAAERRARAESMAIAKAERARIADEKKAMPRKRKVTA
jgi:hypothetical protein